MNPYNLLNTHNQYAVIGMHPDEDTYANKIYNKLKEKGKTVYGLNPKYKEASGDKLFKDLNELDKDVDIAVFVVNPKIGIHMLDDVVKNNIDTIWLQPGTRSDALIKQAKKRNLSVVEDCVLAVYDKNE